MSLIVRYVDRDIRNNDVIVKEAFLSFFLLNKKDAESISLAAFDELKKHDLDFQNCRSFCSDNANVMAGNDNGLQAIFRQHNHLSTFVNCNNHSLNLVGVHAVSEETVMGLFFSILDTLYNFFSRSTLRWDRLKNTLSITLKRECETRWSSRNDAVKVVFLNVKDIIKLLDDMSNDANENRSTRADALNLYERLMTYDFLYLSKFWHDVLSKIDVTQKRLQNPHILFSDAALDLQSLHSFFQIERENIVNACLTDGKALCVDLDVSLERRRRSVS